MPVRHAQTSNGMWYTNYYGKGYPRQEWEDKVILKALQNWSHEETVVLTDHQAAIVLAMIDEIEELREANGELKSRIEDMHTDDDVQEWREEDKQRLLDALQAAVKKERRQLIDQAKKEIEEKARADARLDFKIELERRRGNREKRNQEFQKELLDLKITHQTLFTKLRKHRQDRRERDAEMEAKINSEEVQRSLLTYETKNFGHEPGGKRKFINGGAE